MTDAVPTTGPTPIEVARTGDVAAALQGAARALSGTAEAADIVRAGVSLPQQAVAELSGPTATLVDPSAAGPQVRLGHGRVIAVATDHHRVPDPTTRAVGWLRIAAADREAATQALTAAAEQARALGATSNDPFSWILLAVVRAGIIVRTEPVAPWPWSTDGAVPALTAREAEQIRLVRANRADDSWYSVSVLRRLSTPLTAFAVRHGWSPNAITLISLLVGIGAAALFAVGQRWALVLGALALQVSLVIDCSDGEVARYTGRFSRTGAWLDAVTDRVKEFAAYAGLAMGAALVAGVDLWWAAAATMVLQTVRHLTDYTFDLVQRGWEAADMRRPLADGFDPQPSPAPAPGAAPTAAGAMLRRTLFLPIGERWLLISIIAALLGPTWVFVVLLTLGAVSFGYANLGRAIRTRRWTGGPVSMGAIVAQLDTAPFGIPLPLGARSGALLLGSSVAASVGILLLGLGLPTTGAAFLLVSALLLLGVRAALFRPAWAAPAAVAAIEMVPWLVAGATLAPDGGPWIFAVLFTIAFHRYDLLYRAAAGRRPPTWLSAACAGAPVRLAILAVTILVAPGALTAVAAVLAGYLAVVAVGVGSAQWLAEEAN